jgi:peptidoglycan hydrolase CwlO-like protein
MKGKRIKRWIQKPLRFHHQDIHEELEDLKRLIGYVSGQVQELRDRVDKFNENTSLWLSQQNGTEGE